MQSTLLKQPHNPMGLDAELTIRLGEKSVVPLAKYEMITVIDDSDLFLKQTVARLRRGGFMNVSAICDVQVVDFSMFENTDVVIASLSTVKNFNQFFASLELAKFRGYRGRLVVVADEATCNDLYRAAALGISDFWIKGVSLDIASEVTHLLARDIRRNKETLCPRTIADLGLFRSAGLTPKERALLRVLADGFPRQCEIATGLGKSPTYVNKMFSRIYEKLSVNISVDNPSQLAFLIAICSWFR